MFKTHTSPLIFHHLQLSKMWYYHSWYSNKVMFQKSWSVIKMSIAATMQKSLWQPRVIVMTQNNALLCTDAEMHYWC
jgi:hypothetical protein